MSNAQAHVERHAAGPTADPAGEQPPREPGFLSDHPFLVVDRSSRMRRAFGVSVATHVLVPFLLVFLMRFMPPPQPAPQLPDLTNYNIVWLPQAGPGGGGGGGGNKSLEPPRKVELPGKDKISVPVQKAVNLEAPKPKDEPKPDPVPLMQLPALAMASGTTTLPGVMTGLPSDSSLSQGSGSGEGTGIGPGKGSGLGPGEGGGTGGGVYRPGNGVELPRILREVKPQYTADAMRAKVQGVVELEAVVLPDGSVGDVRVTHSLDPVFGLDEEAIKAVKQWRFAPGTRLGQPVAVLVGIELTFTLR
jgi:protein TonB